MAIAVTTIGQSPNWSRFGDEPQFLFGQTAAAATAILAAIAAFASIVPGFKRYWLWLPLLPLALWLASLVQGYFEDFANLGRRRSPFASTVIALS